LTQQVTDLLSKGRLQEAEWLMRKGAPAPLDLTQLAQRLGTKLDVEHFFVSPGYYAPFSSWAEAKQICGDAYQASSVVERYRQIARSEQGQNLLLRTIGPYAMRQMTAMQHAWLALGRPRSLRVLDFGGALGNHFHSLKPHWPWCSLHWTICETESVASAGQAEFGLKDLGGHQLHFSSNATEILDAGVDIVLASCSLQYIENWQTMLKLFCAAPWLLLDRVPLVDHPVDLIDIQVVPASYTDTRYPGWKFAASSWLPRLKESGFELMFQWLVPEDRWSILDLVTGKIRWQAHHDHGFLLRRHRNAAIDQHVVNF
jgi:putative methyltransferase (TIGR04325 family)